MPLKLSFALNKLLRATHKAVMLAIVPPEQDFDDIDRMLDQQFKQKTADIDNLYHAYEKAIDDAFKGIEAIIHSMTKEERTNPKILNGSRKKRIAIGSGSTVVAVNQLIKQFSQMGKMMKMMQGGGGKQIMEMMKGKDGMPGMR